MKNPYEIVREFEQAVARYTGAPYVVAVNSCTAALMLSLAWWRREERVSHRCKVVVPARTYVSVPMSVVHAGLTPTFADEEWEGEYQLRPTNVWDSARRFTSGMYRAGAMQCTSHHWSKILGIQQGGCILHDQPLADQWLRRMRFDGRTEGVPPKHDTIYEIGWHCYMSPEVAAEGLVRLHFLPRQNADLPNDDYPDLRTLPAFTPRDEQEEVPL